MILTFIISVLSIFFSGFYYGNPTNKEKYKADTMKSIILLFIGVYFFVSTVEKVAL